MSVNSTLYLNFDAEQSSAKLSWSLGPEKSPQQAGILSLKAGELPIAVQGGCHRKVVPCMEDFCIRDFCIVSQPQFMERSNQAKPTDPWTYWRPSPFEDGARASRNVRLGDKKVGPNEMAQQYWVITRTLDQPPQVGQQGYWTLRFVLTVNISWSDGQNKEDELRVFFLEIDAEVTG